MVKLDINNLPEYPEWVNEDSKDMLLKSYLDQDSLKSQFIRMSKAAAKWAPKDGTDWFYKFFEMMWNKHYSNASPCLSNLGNRSKGMPISCSSQFVGNSIKEMYLSKLETALLTKEGYGTTHHLDAIQPRGSVTGSGFVANGVCDYIDTVISDMSFVSQGNRRGSIAFYLDIMHGDFKELCNKLKNEQKDLNVGWNWSDAFTKSLDDGDLEAIERNKLLMQAKWAKGKGYIWYIDKANKNLPEPYKKAGLKNRGSNLCVEMLQITDEQNTLICGLGSLNIMTYDDWPEDLVKTAMVYLDCILSEFIDIAKNKYGFEKIHQYAERFRPVGLGQLGLHSYMQSKNLVWGSYGAMMLDRDIAKRINEESLEASKWLADQLGEPEGCKGFGIRMASRLAIAPTKSSSAIMGGYSQGIEQYYACAFVEDLSSGKVIRENPIFVELLKSKGIYSKQLMQDIAMNHMGSCQHMEELTEHEKLVFRCVFETNQMDVLKHASMRQKHLDQTQSLNLSFGPHATPADVQSVFKAAAKDPWIFGLYYMRRVTRDPSGSIKKVDVSECLACE